MPNCTTFFPSAKTFFLIPLLMLLFTGGRSDLHAQSPAGLDTLQLETIFFEPYLPGVRPSITGFSPIGNHIYFSWNDSSYAETGPYIVDLSGSLTEPVDEEYAHLPRAAVSPNRTSIAYISDNKVMVSGLDGTGERTVFSASSITGTPVWSSDSRRLAFVVKGDVWTFHLEDAHVRQVTEKTDDEPSFFIRGWADNDTRLVLQQTDTSHYRDVYFPRYVPEFVEPGQSRRGQPHVKLTIANLEPAVFDESEDTEENDTDTNGEEDDENGNSRFHVLYEGESYILNTDISADTRYFLYDFTDHDMKEREIRIFDMASDSEITLFSESTEGWMYPSLLQASFAPDGNVLFFTSEESGFNHIYTARGDGSRLTRVTEGDFEIDWVDWIGSNSLTYSSTERDPGLRDLYSVNINTRSTTRMTAAEAFRYDFRVSPDMRYITYMKTTWNRPAEIYVIDVRRPEDEIRLTHSVPERFDEIDWQKPEYYRFMGRDSTMISMDVLKPHNFDPDAEHPVVVFVHGAGSLQNVFQGWSRSYPREYMFHQFLNRHGYVVVEVDYRHSTGYGRAFREDVTNWMGRYELNDIVDGLNFIQDEYGYLDMERVGIYGGSYGGFMALYALSHEPDIFSAGAALRAVTNWVNYYHANPGYTRPRLGTPEDDPEHYERSSPITYADSLARPALILHGLIDDNVGFQDAAQYIDRLILSGNTNFDMMMYPSERHAYTMPESWHDQYLRIFNFFEKHLKN